MFRPRFMVTQEIYDAASAEERLRYNYLVVPDEPIPLPANFCCPHQERDSAENRTESRPLNEK
jgi:hypothetical protein